MPQPKRVETRKIWDKVALDLAFDGLPENERLQPNEWDDVL